MPAGLSPLTGIQATERFRIVLQPEASAAGIHGGPADSKHGQTGETADPYPWIEFAGPHGPYGPAESDMLGILPEYDTLAAGVMAQDPSGDATPYRTHAGPITKGMPASDRDPAGTAEYLQQSAQAHSVRTGAAEKAKASSNPLQDHWIGFWNSVQGEDLVPPLPAATGPSVFGFGNNDRVSNPFHKANQFGLNMSHRMRRYAQSPIPGNNMWMRPGGRMLIKSLPHVARAPIGEGPFQGQDLMDLNYGPQGAILMDNATEYVAPPQPYVVPQDNPVEDSAPPIALW